MQGATSDRDHWIDARKEFLKREKEFTKARDALSAARRNLPKLAIEKDYTFNTTSGQKSLAELFNGNSQLIIYHFMYGPDWEEGCPSCSLWADNFEGIDIHLAHRDISLVFMSTASLDTIQAYRKRMCWTFDWVSDPKGEFSRDMQVSFSKAEIEAGAAEYNYGPNGFPSTEAPGITVWQRDNDTTYHTYGTFGRGLDMLNGAYHLMDIAPNGRDEDGLPWPMAWLRRRDQYEG